MVLHQLESWTDKTPQRHNFPPEIQNFPPEIQNFRPEIHNFPPGIQNFPPEIFCMRMLKEIMKTIIQEGMTVLLF